MAKEKEGKFLNLFSKENGMKQKMAKTIKVKVKMPQKNNFQQNGALFIEKTRVLITI